MINLEDICHIKMHLKFKIKTLKMVTKNNSVINIYNIALVDTKRDLVVKYTRLEQYIIKNPSSQSIFVDDNTILAKCHNVCFFLNQVLIHENIIRIEDLDYLMIKSYIQNYADGNYGKPVPRKQDTVKKMISHVFCFLKNYYDKNKEVTTFKYDGNDLFQPIHSSKQSKNNLLKKYPMKPNIVLRKQRNDQTTKFRDFPEPFLMVLVNTARKYDRMLVLPIMIQAFAGIREGEVCNLEYHDLVRLKKFGFRELNIKNTLFDDFLGVDVGKVKIVRNQQIYEDFVDILTKELSNHLILLESDFFKHKTDLACSKINVPIFYNNYGNVLTRQTYCLRLKSLFQNYFMVEIIDYIKNLNDKNLRQRYELIIEKFKTEYPGAHMLRHWYTMYLLAHIPEVNAFMLMAWRGDRNVESSLTYINNKGMLLEQYREATLNLQELIIGGLISNDY